MLSYYSKRFCRTAAAAALVVLLMLSLTAAEEERDYPHGEFEDDCSLCHRDEAWLPATISPEFDHAERGFALRESHGRAACRTCHTTLEFELADPSCVTCHMDVHRGELGIDCSRCHTPRSFIDRTRMTRRHVESRFPLNGTHLTLDCEDCHVPGAHGILQFVNTPWQCEACHLEEYQSTSDPEHEAAGFPRECQLCHSTRSWIPARFNHSIIAPGSECRDCHLDDYLATSRPNHQTAGFPQQCEACHSTTRWVPASFRDHDSQFFPIYSGPHRGKWSGCDECHVNPADFSEFSCLNCHEHRRSEMDEKHSGMSGYDYQSPLCLNCHPDGRGE